MNAFWQNILWKFAKGFIFAFVGQVIAFLSYIQMYHPAETDPATKWFLALVAAGIAGLIALLKRVLEYDPSKA